MKITCCKGCEDRTVEPNCHVTCERYHEEKEAWQAVKDEKNADHGVREYINVNKWRRKGHHKD